MLSHEQISHLASTVVGIVKSSPRRQWATWDAFAGRVIYHERDATEDEVAAAIKIALDNVAAAQPPSGE